VFVPDRKHLHNRSVIPSRGIGAFELSLFVISFAGASTASEQASKAQTGCRSYNSRAIGVVELVALVTESENSLHLVRSIPRSQRS